ncbi:MAG TPA: MBL fold metallo-hydrolase [Candidatus Limnocylindrales bacterium]|nr:MBL fold metallo-hydrolase [Candidatus Limnocylindrales bacterium]
MRQRATFLGHSTVLLEMGGVRILTDPVLFDRIGILRRAASPLPGELHAAIDGVVISHMHLDHLDLRSVRELGPATRLVVPAGAAGYLRAHGFTDVSELAPGESANVGPVRVTATTAIHSGFRPPFGPNARAVGYLLDCDDERVYFAGDTDLFAEMAGLEGIDLALLPVWGWGPRLGPGHMDPVRAAEALPLLRPRAAAPIHWGTLWPLGLGRVLPHRLTEPPREFASAASEIAPAVDVLLAAPGDAIPIPD